MEIIGEAARHVPDDFKRKHPQIEWREMIGMRDRLIHGYFGVDYEIVWDVVTTKLALLSGEIERMIEDESNPRTD